MFVVILLLQLSLSNGLSLPPSSSFLTASGLPVSRYGLGGAARSTQPANLPSQYFDIVSSSSTAPFFFYYNPHRYANFMSGVKEICETKNRMDIFVAGGGTDRSPKSLDKRLSDCLQYCGGEYLDLFIIEYVLPEELDGNIDNDPIENIEPGSELQVALDHAQRWVKEGYVRYVGISTHSHTVGAALSKSSNVDALMLRYGLSHKYAAEQLSFPAATENGKPVIAFTTTRWNSLQGGLDKQIWPSGDAPTSGDCLSFAFQPHLPIEVVLHSARDEDELKESIGGMRILTEEEIITWRSYGDIFEFANEDSFDEYPAESIHTMH